MQLKKFQVFMRESWQAYFPPAKHKPKLCLLTVLKSISTTALFYSFRAVRTSETPVQEEDSNLEQVESPVDKSGLATAGPSETSTYLDPVDAAVR